MTALQPPTTFEQRLLMQMALDAYLESSWPRLRWLQWTLDLREGPDVDVTEQVDALPHELGGIRLESEDGNSTELLALRVSGCALCERSEPILTVFLSLLRLCIERYAAAERAVLTSGDLKDMPNQPLVQRAFRLLQDEYLFLGSGGSNAETWRYEISVAVRYFRNVRTLEEYIDRRRWYLAEPRPRRVQGRGPASAATELHAPAELFSFMRSEHLRKLAQRDHAELSLSTTTKARVVLAGAVVEAMLLDRLTDVSLAPGNDLLALSLGRLYEVARQRGAVSDRAALVVPAVRDFRNLGHPGAELRDGPLTEAEADIAVSLMRMLIAEFSSTPQLSV